MGTRLGVPGKLSTVRVDACVFALTLQILEKTIGPYAYTTPGNDLPLAVYGVALGTWMFNPPLTRHRPLLDIGA